MDQGLASAASALNAISGHAHLPALWLFTDLERLPDPLKAVGNLPTGCGVVFRHFGVPAYQALGQDLRAACVARELVFLVGMDVGLARRLQADGIHLPERDHGQIAAIKTAHPDWLVTTSAHTLPALKAAQGAQAVFVSPVFPSASPSAGTALGAAVFQDFVRASPKPVYALGGVNAQTIVQLNGSGCAGVAGIGFI